ncbi:MAG: winged helix-turn-helix domain-containing protein [Desulfuromonadaceae bacterium]|nr:winged helix-turn-helix domain-containing protein [Desulfuromonadaceae bacterium]
MINEIGTYAGTVWKFLEQNGESTLSAVVNGTKLSQCQVDRAVGWLAREGKVSLRKDNRRHLISLT